MHRTETKRRLYRVSNVARMGGAGKSTATEARLSPSGHIRITKGIVPYCLQVLYKVLSAGQRRYNVPSRAPYNLTEGASRARSRHHHQLMSTKRNRRAILNGSDCEDNSSSGEEEFTQVRISYLQAYGTAIRMLDRLHFEPLSWMEYGG